MTGRTGSAQTTKVTWSGIQTGPRPVKALVLVCTEWAVGSTPSVLGLQSMIFQSEIYAIKGCVMGNVEKGYTGRNIYILSNSQAANKCSGNAKLVSDCRQSLVKLKEHNRIQLLSSCGGFVSVCQHVLVPTRYMMKTHQKLTRTNF